MDKPFDEFGAHRLVIALMLLVSLPFAQYSAALATSSTASAPARPSGAQAASVGVDDYPYRTDRDLGKVVWGFPVRRSTSFVTWRIRTALGVSGFTDWYKGVHFGVAGTWATSAKSAGVKVDGNASPGSILVVPFNTDGVGALGHLAFVLSSTSTAVTVEDYGWRSPRADPKYAQHTVKLLKSLRFIHFGPASIPPDYTLSVSVRGSGSVSSSPAGPSCGQSTGCSGGYPAGSAVTLTVAPDPGWQFTGWSRGCSGSAPTCGLVITGDENVAATFTQRPASILSVSVSGPGTVTASTGSLSCGHDSICSATYPAGTVVTLTAS